MKTTKTTKTTTANDNPFAGILAAATAAMPALAQKDLRRYRFVFSVPSDGVAVCRGMIAPGTVTARAAAEAQAGSEPGRRIFVIGAARDGAPRIVARAWHGTGSIMWRAPEPRHIENGVPPAVIVQESSAVPLLPAPPSEERPAQDTRPVPGKAGLMADIPDVPEPATRTRRRSVATLAVK